MKSENRQVRASLFRSVCAVVMSMLMVVSMMPTMALTAHAEEGDMILIGASWHDTKAGWDRIDGASYYMVQAFFISYDPGETISSDPVKVNQAYTSVSYDFDEFFEANGSGKYSFSVKAYNEGNELIASGESAKKDFYHVQINMTSLDIDGETELEVEKGGRLMCSVDGGGESTEESTSYYREAGEGETEVSAYSTDGFESHLKRLQKQSRSRSISETQKSRQRFSRRSMEKATIRQISMMRRQHLKGMSSRLKYSLHILNTTLLMH